MPLVRGVVGVRATTLVKVRWWTRERARALAWLLAVVVLTAVTVQNSIIFAADGFGTPAIVVALGCGVVLAIRRLPWFVGPAVVAVCTVVFGPLLMPLFALCLFDLAVRQRAMIAVLSAGLVFAALAVIPSPAPLGPQSVFGSVFALALVTAAGMLIASRREGIASLNAEVERLRLERRVGEERARASERARIATEMHDVLAHRLSMIALHTGVLESKVDGLPDAIGDRLRLLRTASTDALTDLRDVLGVLHDTADDDPHRPVVIDIAELIGDARASGQHVEFAVDGSAVDVPTAQGLAVQRVVQEGLTNVRKHAGGASTTVRIEYCRPTTKVTVENSAGESLGRRTESGFGLVGLRERVRALGGTFEAGANASGGWCVEAVFPAVEREHHERQDIE